MWGPAKSEELGRKEEKEKEKKKNISFKSLLAHGMSSDESLWLRHLRRHVLHLEDGEGGATEAPPSTRDLGGIEDEESSCEWVSVIPVELLERCFVWLDAYSLSKAAMVCKWWRLVALGDFLWKKLLHRRWALKKSHG